MKILVTGGAGYLGSILVAKLLARGHQVRVVDVGYFGVGHLRSYRPAPEVIRKDIRQITNHPQGLSETLEGIQCIIHLAAISNDPSAELNPQLTREINYKATTALAEVARRKKIRFLFSSSCSVYGEGQGKLNEESVINPLTVYAASKVDSERMLEGLADSSWSPIILRNGTLFGHSPRMRFDLVVNIFSLYTALYNRIKVFGDGRQWRPFLHVEDCARAFVHFAETTECRHHIYNVAHENLRVIDLVGVFEALNPRLKVEYLDLADQDRRDYRVSARRMHDSGFKTRISVALGAEQVVDAIVSGLITDPESVFCRNAKWLKQLTELESADPQVVLRLLEAASQSRRFEKT